MAKETKITDEQKKELEELKQERRAAQEKIRNSVGMQTLYQIAAGISGTFGEISPIVQGFLKENLDKAYEDDPVLKNHLLETVKSVASGEAKSYTRESIVRSYLETFSYLTTSEVLNHYGIKPEDMKELSEEDKKASFLELQFQNEDAHKFIQGNVINLKLGLSTLEKMVTDKEFINKNITKSFEDYMQTQKLTREVLEKKVAEEKKVKKDSMGRKSEFEEQLRVAA